MKDFLSLYRSGIYSEVCMHGISAVLALHGPESLSSTSEVAALYNDRYRLAVSLYRRHGSVMLLMHINMCA